MLAISHNLRRTLSRGRLRELVETPLLLTRLLASPDGQFTAETQSWDEYWSPVPRLGFHEVDATLETLRRHWRQSLQTKFDPVSWRAYCHTYFSLLNALLTVRNEVDGTAAWQDALRVTAGFECFGIALADSPHRVLAAGTTTVRHPAYLLGKLRWPDALDDTQFLPAIGVPLAGPGNLFYHYRQHKLAADSPASLLLYLAAVPQVRPLSFRVLRTLEVGIADSSDPRATQRARRLCQQVLIPLLESARDNLRRDRLLELVDVGAGSGTLTAAISRQLIRWAETRGFDLRLQLNFVDIDFCNPARSFRAPDLSRLADSTMFVGADYRDWLGWEVPLPQPAGLRIACVSKLVNSQSNVVLRSLSAEEAARLGSGRPADCGDDPVAVLAPGAQGPSALAVSTSRARLTDGHAYSQPALSNFYRALFEISAPAVIPSPTPDGIYLPVRSLNQASLFTRIGASVFARLLDVCHYVLVEDADLTPAEFCAHLEEHCPRAADAFDVSWALRLRQNYAYVLARDPLRSVPERWRRLRPPHRPIP